MAEDKPAGLPDMQLTEEEEQFILGIVEGTGTWQPCRDPKTLRTVGKTLEELHELGKVLSRVVLQGFAGIDPSTGRTNREALENEIGDVLANISLLMENRGLDAERVAERSVEKYAQLKTWLDETV